MTKRITKSADRMLSGVCGGVADYFELDPTLIRVCYTAFTCFTGFFPGVLLYVMLVIIVPNEDRTT